MPLSARQMNETIVLNKIIAKREVGEMNEAIARLGDDVHVQGHALDLLIAVGDDTEAVLVPFHQEIREDTEKATSLAAQKVDGMTVRSVTVGSTGISRPTRHLQRDIVALLPQKGHHLL